VLHRHFFLYTLIKSTVHSFNTEGVVAVIER